MRKATVTTALASITIMLVVGGMGLAQSSGCMIAIGGNQSDEGANITAIPGGYVLMGNAQLFQAGGGQGHNAVTHYLMARLDDQCNIQWSKIITSTGSGNSVRRDNGWGLLYDPARGALLLSGKTKAHNPSIHHNLAIVGIDASTTAYIVDTRAGDENIEDYDHVRIKKLSNGNYVIFGDIKGESPWGTGTWDGFIVTADPSLNILDVYRLGDAGVDEGLHDIVEVSDGYVGVMWKDIHDEKSRSSNDADILLFKTDHGFNLLWAKLLQPATVDNETEVPWRLIPAPDGSGYYVVATTESFTGTWDILVIKADVAGNVVWSRWYGTPTSDEFVRSAELSASGQHIGIVGFTNNSGGLGGDDILVLSIDLNGSVVWAYVFGGAQDDEGVEITASVSDPDAFMVVGTTWSLGAGGADIIAFTAAGDAGFNCNALTYTAGWSSAPINANPFSLPILSNNMSSTQGVITSDISIGPSFNCTLMPTELTYFKATLRDSFVTLEWEYTSPSPQISFTLEHSLTTHEWEEVVTVSAKTGIHRYSAQHPTSQQTIHYYRLRINTPAGISYSRVVSADLRSSASGLALYAHTTKGGIKIELYNAPTNKPVLVVVQNPLGETLYSRVFVTDNTEKTVIAIDPQQKLSPGVYLITGSTNEQLVSYKLVITDTETK